MARKASDTLTEAEQRIMEILWTEGEASVRAVAEIIAKDKSVAYTTVLTMLKILYEKGHVTRRNEGRAFIYAPATNRQTARSGAVKQLVARFFDQSPEKLAQFLIQEDALDATALGDIQRELEAKEGNRD